MPKQKGLGTLKINKAKLFALIAVAFVGIPTVLFVSLVIAQTYSVWEASKTLDRLEKLRVGDQAESFAIATESCQPLTNGCFLEAGAYHWSWFERVSPEWSEHIESLASRGGLPWWVFSAFRTLDEGRISRISVSVMVVAPQKKVLVGAWTLSPTLLFIPNDLDRDAPTSVTPVNVTSTGPAEGYRVNVTDRSSATDLQARAMNRRCLLPFGRCECICQLLPHAGPLLLKEHLNCGDCAGPH